MNEPEDLQIAYEFNGNIFTVTGETKLHYRLQNDLKFCEEYFTSLMNQSPEGIKRKYSEISDGPHGCQDRGKKENTGSSCDPTPNTSTGFLQSTACSKVLGKVDGFHDRNESCENNNNNDEFKWTRQVTLLLLSLYKGKCHLFRNSKMKNKDIWLEILKEFKKQGYNSVTIEILDRKMRNLKKTYKDNKDKKKKTGESCIMWEYFEIMDDIFFNDKTINPSSTVSSMESVHNSSQATTASLNLEIGPSTEQSKNEKPKVEEKIEKESTKTNQAKRVKHLYDHRKKIQEIERQRLEEVNKLREAIERNNEIQNERNEILRQLLRK